MRLVHTTNKRRSTIVWKSGVNKLKSGQVCNASLWVLVRRVWHKLRQNFDLPVLEGGMYRLYWWNPTWIRVRMVSMIHKSIIFIQLSVMVAMTSFGVMSDETIVFREDWYKNLIGSF